jgi:hypothetical protein
MRYLGFAGRSLIGLMLVVGLLFASAAPGGAVSKYTRLRIHVSTCPKNTGDVFGKCYGNVQSGINFTVVNPTGHPTTRATDSDGFVRFGPRGGTIAIHENSTTFAKYGKARVFCAIKNNGVQGKTLFDAATTTSTIHITTKGGDTVHCDWYNLT